MTLKYNFLPGESPASPLLIFVHGRAGNLLVTKTFQRYTPDSWNKLFVEAPIQDPIGGYSWWLIGENTSHEEAAENFEKEIFNILEKERIDPTYIYGLGFSQGAALLSILVQKKDTFLSGVAILAGFVFRNIKDKIEKAIPVFMAHGTNDEVITIEKAYSGKDFLISKGFDLTFVEDPVGHKIGSNGTKKLAEWFANQESAISR